MRKYIIFIFLSFVAVYSAASSADNYYWATSAVGSWGSKGGLCAALGPYSVSGDKCQHNTCGACSENIQTFACAAGQIFQQYGDYDNPANGGICVSEFLCEDGSEPDADLGLCPPIPECPAGESWNSTTEQCETPDLDCPVGEHSNTFLSGGNWQTQCIPDTQDTKAQDCENIDGYITDADGREYQACADDRLDCESTGGTYGMINDEFVCLPDEYADDIPDCDLNSLYILESGGGYTCAAVEPSDDPENPNVPNQSETDTDGDGTPDSDDSDIDGDGTPNGTDPDIDGDGIPNEDDPTPNGDGDQPSVQGGGSCESRPVCSGDEIQCAILYQTWSQRCESGASGGTEQIDDATAGQLQSSGDTIVGALIDTFETSVSDSIGDGDSGAIGPTNIAGDINSGFLDVGACSDMSFNWLGQTVAITCAKTQTLRDVLAWIVSLYTLFAVFNIATKSPVPAR